MEHLSFPNPGVFVAASRYLDARALRLKLLHGLAARHMAAAAISKTTKAVRHHRIADGNCASVQVRCTCRILPQLWLLGRYSSYLPGPVRAEKSSDVAVVVRENRAVTP